MDFEFLALLKWQVGCQVQERKRERERDTHAHEMRVKREGARSCVFSMCNRCESIFAFHA